MTSQPALTFRHAEPGKSVIEGVIDEQSVPVLSELAAELAAGLAAGLTASPSIELDVAGVRRINSLGVRAWIDFMRTLGKRTVTLLRCSPAFVDQLNMVSDFRGHARIASFLAPYVCESSGNVFFEELTVGKDVTAGNYAGIDRRSCAECPEPLVFDDLPERYLQFLSFA